MIDQITSIDITGGPFTSSTHFDIFAKRFTLLYGCNGSGKSTIAKAVRCACDETIDNYTGAFNVGIDEGTRNRIFVFDEQFTRENVLIGEDEIGSIVMLGHQVELDAQINQLTAEKDRLSHEKETIEGQLNALSDTTNSSSPNRLFQKLRDSLKADGGWAEIDRDLRQRKIDSRIDLSLVDRLTQYLSSITPYEDVFSQFSEYKSRYNKIANKNRINTKLNYNGINNIQNLRSLLDKQVQKPELTDRDRMIIDAIQGDDKKYLNDTKKVFSNNQTSRCPLCLQEVSPEYKVDLLRKVHAYFNKEVEDYKQRCNRWSASLNSWRGVTVPKEISDILSSDNSSKIKTVSLILEKKFKELAKEVDKRSADVFAYQTNFNWKELENAMADYEGTVASINSLIDSYNEDVKNKEAIKTQLLNLNDQLAAFNNKHILESYNQQKKKEDDLKNKIKHLQNDIEQKENQITDLNAQKQQVGIALDFINSFLSYIFFDKQHLQLKAEAGKYKILVNNRNVKPDLISTGERNALSLCYFFAKTFENREKDHRYDEEELFVIDDPVSSFDQANKVGIMSFLRLMFGKINDGNPNSKILVMTHDQQVFFDLKKIFKDIPGEDNKLKVFTLTQTHEMIDAKINTNLYKALLNDVYDVANGDDLANVRNIGNNMRKLLEAFFTFFFNSSFMKGLHDREVLDLLPERKRVYYGNLMARLVLNSESHTEEAMYSLNNFFDLYEANEIKKTAQSVLTFLYNINKLHIEKYLSTDKAEVIRKWTEEEKIDEI